MAFECEARVSPATCIFSLKRINVVCFSLWLLTRHEHLSCQTGRQKAKALSRSHGIKRLVKKKSL